MRIRSILAAAVAAAAVLAPAAPSQAAGVKPCDMPGHVGVVVYGGDGDILVVCLRPAGAVELVEEVVEPYRDYPGEVVDWVEAVRGIRCWSYPDGSIACDNPPRFPTPWE